MSDPFYKAVVAFFGISVNQIHLRSFGIIFAIILKTIYKIILLPIPVAHFGYELGAGIAFLLFFFRRDLLDIDDIMAA